MATATITAYSRILRREAAHKAVALRRWLRQAQEGARPLAGWSVDPARARSRARFLRKVRNKIVRRFIGIYIADRK